MLLSVILDSLKHTNTFFFIFQKDFKSIRMTFTWKVFVSQKVPW